MKAEKLFDERACSPEELDEAAVWLARLRDQNRSPSVERGFRRWLTAKRSHAAAFETISEAWELTGALQRRPFPKLTRWERAGFRAGFLRSTLAVTAVATLVLAAATIFIQAHGVATAVGEQRVLTLEDGSRISLNTDSRVVIKYDARERRVELKSGEAFFEVAKQSHRPFVVAAAGKHIRALGTSFVVRQDERALAITLVDGKVAVFADAPREPAFTEGNDRSSKTLSDDSAKVVTLTPGQRLTLEIDNTAHIDLPPLEKITAWRRGQVELEDATLADAVREINRYSSVKLTVATPLAASIRINGVFQAGDAKGFAAAVARSYGLIVARRSNEIVLSSASPPISAKTSSAL